MATSVKTGRSFGKRLSSAWVARSPGCDPAHFHVQAQSAAAPSLVVLLALLLAPIAALAAPPATERIPLWGARAPVGDGRSEATPPDAVLTVYRPDQPNGAALVICPGGSYVMRATGPEGTHIAEWLNRHGITGAVLDYRLPRGRPDVPLLDAEQAIRIVRSRARAWGVDPHRVGIIGFSAGGHLAASAASLHAPIQVGANDPLARLSSRPDFTILIYPVISMQDGLTHRESRTHLLGRQPGAALIRRHSIEMQVGPDTPPTYLAHAVDDPDVPIGNSRAYAQALRAQPNGKRVELLELPSGGHGLDGFQGPNWKAWQAGSLKWLARQRIIPAEAVGTP